MRDPYDILGVAPGAGLAEIKAAYRKKSRETHPDLGGSHEAFIELQNAYASILNDLKSGRQRRRAEAPEPEPRARSGPDTSARPEDMWTNEAFWRDIDEELEGLRRATEFYEEAFRARRAKAWERGDKIGWARLSLADIARFFRELLRSGARGVILLFAALAGVGAIVAQFNLVSALIILGSGFGLFVSLAMKHDKGGVLSAFLLLFGLLTIWSPGVRAAVLGQPFATLSALVCLGLIVKFVQERSLVGLATGGTLAIYILSLIGQDVQPGRRVADQAPEAAVRAPHQPHIPLAQAPPAPSTVRTTQQPVLMQPAQLPGPASPPEPRILLAANGSLLRFVHGVPYQLRVRGGMTTILAAESGKVAFYRGEMRISDCTNALEFSTTGSGSAYQDVDQLLRACEADAVLRVVAVR